MGPCGGVDVHRAPTGIRGEGLIDPCSGTGPAERSAETRTALIQKEMNRLIFSLFRSALGFTDSIATIAEVAYSDPLYLQFDGAETFYLQDAAVLAMSTCLLLIFFRGRTEEGDVLKRVLIYVWCIGF